MISEQVEEYSQIFFARSILKIEPTRLMDLHKVVSPYRNLITNDLSQKINVIEKMVGSFDYEDKFSLEDCGYVQVISNSQQSTI